MNRRTLRKIPIAAAAAWLLGACGGSGSTGLILPESALFDRVRETGACVDGLGTTYCAATRSEIAGDPPQPTCPEDGPCLGTVVLFAFDTGDIATGTPCAVATRLPAADWRLGEPEMASRETTFPVLRPPAYDPSDGPLEAALLCFDPPPGPLPETLEMLADAGPSIVFVAPLLSAGGPTGSEQRSGARARRGA